MARRGFKDDPNSFAYDPGSGPAIENNNPGWNSDPGKTYGAGDQGPWNGSQAWYNPYNSAPSVYDNLTKDHNPVQPSYSSFGNPAGTATWNARRATSRSRGLMGSLGGSGFGRGVDQEGLGARQAIKSFNQADHGGVRAGYVPMNAVEQARQAQANRINQGVGMANSGNMALAGYMMGR